MRGSTGNSGSSGYTAPTFVLSIGTVGAPPRPPGRAPDRPAHFPERPWRPRGATAAHGKAPRPRHPGLRLTATPTLLRLYGVAVAVLAAGFAALLTRAVVAADDGLRVVGQGAGPQVVAANNLYLGLASMDAELANIVLVGDEIGLGYTRADAQAAYRNDRTVVAEALRASAANASGAAARDTVGRLVDDLGAYDNLAGQITYADAQDDARRLQDPSPALPNLRRATDMMHNELLPCADALLDADAASVTHGYQDGRDEAAWYAALALAVGILLVLLLIGGQIFLFRRTHRVFNPILAAVTVAAMCVVAIGAGAAFDARDELDVAKHDAFDSVLALTRTKALVADANGDESRWLVDPANARQYADRYADTTRLLTMQFSRELDNITFDGERDAAQTAYEANATYQAFDTKMRGMASADFRGAVDFNTSHRAGNSNWAYERLQSDLDAVVAINRTHMTAASDTGERDLGAWSWLASAAAVALALATWRGIRPRLREYRNP